MLAPEIAAAIRNLYFGPGEDEKVQMQRDFEETVETIKARAFENKEEALGVNAE